jgi:hypothetical protein
MAQAQVIITAVDRTQAALKSVSSGMKTLEKTAKVTSKAINLAFGLLTGAALVGSFNKIAEAAKKTEEGRRALDRFNTALKDPTLVQAANSFTAALVTGFAKVVEFSAEALRGVKAIGQEMGVIGPDIDRSQLTGNRGGFRGFAARGRRSFNETTAMENDWKFRQKALATEKKWAEAAAEARAKVNEADAARAREMAAFKKDLEEIPELFSTTFTAADVTMASSVQKMLEEMNMADDMMLNFAQQAASSIQTAFADFLFDPFQNGLRGMVKGFIDAIRRMIAELMASYLLRQFFQYMSGFGGIAGSIGQFAVSTLSARAMGGPVTGNTPYMVGERGPELFVPNTSGSIVPNHAMGGVNVSPVYNIDARGATADLQKALPGIMAENNRRIFDELDRRYGIGR